MISVIVPIYNAEQYLYRCVDSILAQSYTDFELLLIDDGSLDSSGAICDEYAEKYNHVRVWHKVNGGVSSARNLGLDNARGEWITFCDSDDYVDRDWLMVYEDYLCCNHDIIIQGVNKLISDKLEEIIPTKLQGGLEEKKELIVKLFTWGIYGYTVNKLFKHELIEKESLRFDENSTCAEDSQFVSKFMEYANSFTCIDEAHYFYNIPESNKKYGGNYYYSFIPIAHSLDNIFEKKLPLYISRTLYGSIKDYLVLRIMDGDTLDSYCLDLYCRLIETLGCNKKFMNKALNFFILNSNRCGRISKYIMRIIHRI